MTSIQAMTALANDLSQASKAKETLVAARQDINNVLEVIRSITEQTPLLSLNAAIEAARAGEQGRGFAVVADEVRALAAKTNDSTNEINRNIEALQNGIKNIVRVMDESAKRADASLQQAGIAKDTLDNIHQTVLQVADLSIQIAGTTEEQSQTAQELRNTISMIANAADETAQGAQQTAESGEMVSELASEMLNTVRQFKTRHTTEPVDSAAA